ncbi:Ig-like domain-containing protein [Viscerimonas tarda]
MRRITLFLSALLMCLSTFAQGLPQAGKNYNIRNVGADLYLSYVADNWNISRIKEASGDDDQVWRLEATGEADVFNIAHDGQYLTKHQSNGWDNVLTADPAADAAKFVLTAADEGITIQLLANRGGALYYAPQASGAGSSVYLNSTAAANLQFWQFEEVIEASELEVKTLAPLADAVKVAVNATVSVLFTKDIVAGDLSGITIKEAGGVAVAEVAGAISGARLNIAHAAFAFGKTYTVTVPAGAIADYAQPVTWSFTIANPVIPQEPRSYNIKNAATGYYLTVPVLPPAGDSYMNTTSKIESDGAETQIFSFSNPDPAQPAVFNIAVGGKFLSKVTGSAWASTLVEEPVADSQFEVTVEGAGIKIRALANTATQFLAPNNANINTACYLDKNNLIAWELEEVDLPLAIYKRFPAVNAPSVAINAEVKAQFNKDITVGDLTLVTIKDGAGNSVSGVSATVNGATVTIAHDEFGFGETYEVAIPVGVVTGLEEAVTWSFTTEAAPAIASVTPARNASDIAIAANTVVKVDFDKAIIAGDLSGVTISANGTALEGVLATVSEQTLSITHPVFDYSTVYTVTIPAGTVKGIVADSWTFTTTAAPTVKSATPVAGAINVALTTLIRVTYDKQPVAGPAGLDGVTLKNAAGDDLTGKISISGSALVIAKATGVSLAEGTVYTVTVPANTIKGFTEAFSYSFTTVGGSGIGDVNADNAVVVYPSKGSITVVTPSPAKISIADISGKQLATYQSNGNITIPANYANGLYIVRVNANGSISSHKVIVE